MSDGRRRYSAASLLLVVALLVSVFTADASARHYSKAQKAKIGKQLLRQVKKSKGRVLHKRWFLKKASQVDWTLPLTIRLLPAVNQQGGRQRNAQTTVNGAYVSGTSLTVASSAGFKAGQSIFVFLPGSPEDSATVTAVPNATTLTLNAGLSGAHSVGHVVSTIPGGANQATLDLGPSLGVRSIGLGGFVPARINFSDAFSGGQLGDVKLSIPPNSQVPGGVTTTSVPLLANPNTSTVTAPNNAIDYFIFPTTTAAGNVSLYFQGCGAGTGVGFRTAPIAETPNLLGGAGGLALGSLNSAALNAALQTLNNPKTNCSGAATPGSDVVGSGGVYAYVSPFANPQVPGCTTAGSCAVGQIVFTGPKFNGTPMPPLLACTGGPTCPDATDTATYVPTFGAPPSPFAVAGNAPGIDIDGQGGCGGTGGTFPGNGSGNDTDLLTHLNTSMNPPKTTAGFPTGWPSDADQYDNVGPGPSYGGSTNPKDTVLRTGPLSAKVADPGTVKVPGDHQGALGIFSESTGSGVYTGSGLADYTIGASGGKANLFGTAVNGLSSGNSVDVTVNLGVDVMTIARQVDGGFPGPNGAPDETLGNINAYANCRQAWSGVSHDYLTNVHLVGALKISPAITADGHLRIAKTYLHSPYPSRQSLAACLEPYKLYMQGSPFVVDAPYSTGYPGGNLPAVGPNLIGGVFNPLVELTGSFLGSPFASYIGNAIPSQAPTADCNSAGPLNRAPFNVANFGGGTSLSNVLTTGAAVAVSADLSVSNLEAEAIIGDIAGG